MFSDCNLKRNYVTILVNRRVGGLETIEYQPMSIGEVNRRVGG